MTCYRAVVTVPTVRAATPNDAPALADFLLALELFKSLETLTPQTLTQELEQKLEAASPSSHTLLVAADEAGDLERVSELEVRMWVDGPRRGPDVVDPALRDLVREMNLIALENEALQLGEEAEPEIPAASRLSRIQAPTLVLVGDEDRARTLAAADLLERELPDARKTVMAGTAHLPNMERPEEFNRLVLDFLKGLGP